MTSLTKQLEYVDAAISKMNRDPGWSKGMTEDKIKERTDTLFAIRHTIDRALMLEQASIDAMKMFDAIGKS
jgi:hypothetical protein